MNALYAFLTGPGVWIALTVFIGGLILRGVCSFGALREKDVQFHNHSDLGWSAKSIASWLIPFGSVGWRSKPFFATAFFLFHLCLLVVPIFLSAHNILWEEKFGWSLPALPDAAADAMVLVFILCAAFLFVRRLVLSEVRVLSEIRDYLLLLLTAAPFVTGFLAYHHIGDDLTMMILHVASAEILLIVVPLSKLSHLMFFFFTRAAIGSEMGARREWEGRLGARTW